MRNAAGLFDLSPFSRSHGDRPGGRNPGVGRAGSDLHPGRHGGDSGYLRAGTSTCPYKLINTSEAEVSCLPMNPDRFEVLGTRGIHWKIRRLPQ